MRIFAAPKIEPGRIMVIENDIVVIDGRLADLITDAAADGADFDVYLNPVDVESFRARWCKDARRLN
jgi:hypothetical protein